MAEHSDFDFVGGYDFREEAGLLHVADHHFSPGKKQWTWGCGDFGQAWDRGLTDADGPYIELMTGVYTENQPDFTWLKPFEEKTFTQYFMPYKKVGQVSNATINAVLKAAFEKDAVNLTVYATAEYKDAQVIIRKKGEEVYRKAAHISPVDIFEDRAELSVEKETDFTVLVLSGNQVLVEYTPVSQGIPEIGKPAEAAKDPEEILTNEELLLTAQHIEQHRHAAFMPDPYYLEGLKRDPGDIRINNAYGMLLTRRGQFLEAEKHFRAAIRRMTWRSPNPYTSEAYYNLGIVLFYQEDKDGAYDAFYKAAWSNEQQEMSYYYLALIDTARGNLERALELCEKGLVKNMHNVRARGLKASLLRKLGKKDEAVAWIGENLELDSFDFLSRYELSLLEEKNEIILKEMNELMRGFHENYLIVARDYADAELFEEAVGILEESRSDKPMVHYYLAYYLERCGKREEAGREYGCRTAN